MIHLFVKYQPFLWEKFTIFPTETLKFLFYRNVVLFDMKITIYLRIIIKKVSSFTPHKKITWVWDFSFFLS